MLTDQQKIAWRTMVEAGDRQGLVNACCYQQMVHARFYGIRCKRFVLQRKIAQIDALVRQHNWVVNATNA